jgi:putative Mg2+ transporter-C (MgtC) family protein
MIEIEILIKIIVAAVLGGFVGLERTVASKHAGMRTFALVAVGSALFIIISQLVVSQYIGLTNFDPLRVMASIVSGIGFLGAGMILMQKDALHGLTTAAGLWATAGIGAAVGFGMYYLATFTVLVILVLFTGMWFIEEWVREKLKIKINKK